MSKSQIMREPDLLLLGLMVAVACIMVLALPVAMLTA
jgi:hypothetical protein